MNSLRPYRAWLWLAAALIAIGAADFIGSHPSQPSVVLSSRSAADDGGLALSLWLRRTGHDITTLTRPVDPCSGRSTALSVLLVMQDGADIPSSAVGRCTRWLRDGGSIVAVSEGRTAIPFLDSLHIRLAPASTSNVSIVQPALDNPPASDISAQTSTVIASGPPALVVAAASDGPALARYQIQRGTLWVLTAPQILENQSLRDADNARVAENLLPAGSHIRIEEYTGQSATISTARNDWLTGSAWGVAFLFAFGVILLYRGMTGIRMGPPVRPIRDTHRPASEYVVSMAGTLRDAKKRADILKQYQEGLSRTVRDHSIDSSASQGARHLALEADALLKGRTVSSNEELVRQVQSITEFEDRLEKTRV